MSAQSALSDATVKVLLIGDSGVGKSSLLMSFTCGTFDPDISATIGIDFKTKKVEVISGDSGERKLINLQLWDTAGQERFRTLTSSYYRGAKAVVLVYDVNEPQSFLGLTKWLDEAMGYCDKSAGDSSVVFLLIGNKTDLCASEEAMPVSKETAQAFAQQHHMLFALTSARTRRGVAEAFDEVARTVYDSGELDAAATRNTHRLEENGHQGGGGGCC